VRSLEHLRNGDGVVARQKCDLVECGTVDWEGKKSCKIGGGGRISARTHHTIYLNKLRSIRALCQRVKCLVCTFTD